MAQEFGMKDVGDSELVSLMAALDKNKDGRIGMLF